jgi:hypothetical protein
MATIQFEDGTKVQFDGTPTPQDVEEVASKLNLKKTSSIPESLTPSGGSLTMKSTGGFEDVAKTAYNVLPSLGRFIKGVAYDAPKQLFTSAYQSAKELPTSVPKAIQSIKESPSGAGKLALKALEKTPEAIYETLVPKALKNAGAVINAYARGDVSKGDELLQNLQKVTTQEPTENWLPLVAGFRAVAELKGMGKVADAGISKTARITGVPQAAEKVSSGFTEPFAKSFVPERQAAFQAEGIKAPPSTTTTSTFLQGAEALVSKGPFGRPVTEMIQVAWDKLNEIKTKVTTDLRSTKEPLTQEQLGATLKQEIGLWEKTNRQTQRTVFDEFNKKYGGSPAVTNATVAAIDNAIFEQKASLYRGADKNLQSMMEKITGESPEIAQLKAQGVKLPPGIEKTPSLTFRNLDSTAADIWNTYERTGNPIYKKIYGEISKDMAATVEQVDPTAGGLLRKINSGYETLMKEVEGSLLRSIERSNPESVAKNIFKRNSVEFVKQLKAKVPKDTFDAMGSALVDNLIKQATDKAGNFDALKFNDLVTKKYDAPTLIAWLGKEKYGQLVEATQRLARIADLEKYMREGTKMSTGSQTAFMLRESSMVANLIRSLLGHYTVGVVTGGASLLAEWLGSKMLSKRSPFITGEPKASIPQMSSVQKLSPGLIPQSKPNQ